MRKVTYFILMMALVASQTLTAAPAKKKSNNKKATSAKEWKGATRNLHHVAVWGGAGYSGLLNKYDNSRFIGGGGGMLGVGYEYRYDHFMFHLGPEFRIFSSMDKLTFPYTYDVAMMANGYTQTKHYAFGDPLKENHVVGQVMLPLMFGGQWDRYFFLAGVKVGYTVLGSYKQSGTLTTTITDEMAFDPTWTNMPNHGAITDAPHTTTGSNNYGLDVTASAEFGVQINSFLGKEWNDRNEAGAHPLRMRASLFVDYGVVNMTPKSEGAIVMADEQQIRTRSLHASDWANGRLNSLLVGVKFTALLQMNKPEPPKPQKPTMVLYVKDSQTDKAIASATVEIMPKEGKKPRATRRNTNAKGMLVAKLAPGGYALSLSHPNYQTLSHDYSHGEWGDTLSLSLMPRPEFRCYVRDAKTNALLAAEVTFVNAANEALIATCTTDSVTGHAHQLLPINTSLRIHIEATDHFALTQSISDIGGEETYLLEPIVKKRAIILHNLFFATNMTTILPESEAALQDLYDLMNENPEIRIRIIGHTDNVGSEKANQRLSEGRANSVRNDMIRRGISADRIEAEGKGESQPITTNDTEEGRAQNRRVEFMIL